MPWTKAQDVTAQDVEAFEMMLDAIAQQDREAKLRAAHHYEVGWDHADASPRQLEVHHD